MTNKNNITSLIKELSDRLNFPIKSVEDLMFKLGKDFKISLSSKSVTLYDIKNYIKPAYFPIADKIDFVNKAIKLCEEYKLLSKAD